MDFLNDFKRLSIFSDVAENDILAMAHCFNIRIKYFSKNSIIINSSQSLNDVILIVKGGVNVENWTSSGDISIVMKLRDGDLYALEGAFGQEEKYSDELKATEKTCVAFLSKHRLLSPCENRCKRHIQLIRKLMAVVANKNFQLLEKISILSKKTIREKVLTYLYLQSGQDSSKYFEIPFNKTELAGFLAVDRSALSSELNNLKKEGVIDFDKKRYKILNFKRYDYLSNKQ